MEDARAAAVVLPSLFEEQINHETRELDFLLTHGTYSYAEALTYFAEPRSFHLGPDAYLEHVRRAKDALSIPVIGSLNGVSIPVAVKLSPHFTNVAAMARRLDESGAPGLVFFNHFFQPDIDLDALEVVSQPTLSRHAGTAAAVVLDRHCVRACSRKSGSNQRSPCRARCCETADGRRGGDDDGVGTDAERHRTSRRRQTRSPGVARRARYQ